MSIILNCTVSAIKDAASSLISGNLATTRNGNTWYDTSVHAPKVVNNGVVNELATFKFQENFSGGLITASLNFNDLIFYVPFIPNCDMDVTKIFYNLQSAGTDTVRVGIFANGTNMPTTLLIQGNESITGATVTNLRSITIAKTRLIGGTKYWLAIKVDIGAGAFGVFNPTLSNSINLGGYQSGAMVTNPSPTGTNICPYLAIGI